MEIYIPGQGSLKMTTHMTVAAHQDDIELTSLAVIGACMESEEKHFTGVVMTDGASSPRTGAYANVTDQEMVRLRAEEQKKAADIGRYNALAMGGYSSAEIKNMADLAPAAALAELIRQCRPKFLFTHNPVDRHPTHLAVMNRTVQAIRLLPKEERPEKLIGCEVWRALDWLPGSRRIMLDTGRYIPLAQKLLGAFESQIAGGKRYDAAWEGRQRANATFSESHACDTYDCASIALDMTGLIEDDALTVKQFTEALIEEFRAEVLSNL